MVTTIDPDPAGPGFAAALTAVGRLATTGRPCGTSGPPGPARPHWPRPAWCLVEEAGLTERVRVVDGRSRAANRRRLLARTRIYLGHRRRRRRPGSPVGPCSPSRPGRRRSGRAPASTMDDRAVTGRLIRRDSAVVGATLGWSASAGGERPCSTIGRRWPAVVVPPRRTDWLTRVSTSCGRSSPTGRAARASSPVCWAAADAVARSPDHGRTWTARAVRALGVTCRSDRGYAGGSRAVWGLGAIATGRRTGCCAAGRRAVRDLVAPSRPTSPARPTSYSACGDAVLASVERRPWSGQHADRPRAAHRSGTAWPCFGERLRPGDIRLATRWWWPAGSRRARSGAGGRTSSTGWPAGPDWALPTGRSPAPLVPAGDRGGRVRRGVGDRVHRTGPSGTPGWRTARWRGSTARTRRPRRSTTPRSARVERAGSAPPCDRPRPRRRWPTWRRPRARRRRRDLRLPSSPPDLPHRLAPVAGSACEHRSARGPRMGACWEARHRGAPPTVPTCWRPPS